jgi:hypothetical protein
MRALLLVAAAALLAVPAIPVGVPSLGAPPAASARELSHGFFTPYMNQYALDIPRGIRPGAWLEIGDANCTASFVVQDPTGALYITTAGHCTSGPGQRASIKENALIGMQNDIHPFGTVVANWPHGLDAALIRIDAEQYADVNPTMLGWGGPTGLLTSIPAQDPVIVRHYGWGWATWYEQNTRCRSGVADLASWDSTTWWYFGLGGGGDSGSAVMTSDGLAMGILDWGAFAIPTVVTSAFVSPEEGGTRFDQALAAFSQVLGKQFTLVPGGPLNAVCQEDLPLR